MHSLEPTTTCYRLPDGQIVYFRYDHRKHGGVICVADFLGEDFSIDTLEGLEEISDLPLETIWDLSMTFVPRHDTHIPARCRPALIPITFI
jgi:hypothetical protein